MAATGGRMVPRGRDCWRRSNDNCGRPCAGSSNIPNEGTPMNPQSADRTARISRRQMLYALSVGAAGTAVDWPVPADAAQAAPAAGTPPLATLNRFPRMVQEFFVARENALHQQRLERLAALSTKADAEAYV